MGDHGRAGLSLARGGVSRSHRRAGEGGCAANHNRGPISRRGLTRWAPAGGIRLGRGHASGHSPEWGTHGRGPAIGGFTWDSAAVKDRGPRRSGCGAGAPGRGRLGGRAVPLGVAARRWGKLTAALGAIIVAAVAPALATVVTTAGGAGTALGVGATATPTAAAVAARRIDGGGGAAPGAAVVVAGAADNGHARGERSHFGKSPHHHSPRSIHHRRNHRTPTSLPGTSTTTPTTIIPRDLGRVSAQRRVPAGSVEGHRVGKDGIHPRRG